ncbi:sialidase family protein [Pseudoalteromonas sp. MMG022]|uniref:sialidase family protein n=1 Tax=Pseudoalteromonas sp. MMG022 TaxID=2909978 RepID=UPI001F431ED4|nr:sialidase family protein [Pseudoalteromonas sp. MMG022]MCF6434237.1 glycoside hydrolase [Pseudoalteromonas sp. MMG022]
MFDHLNTSRNLVCIAVAMSLLSACGGGDSGSATSTPNIDTDKATEIVYPLQGVAVKGPLQFADVKIYQFDKHAPNGLGKLLGTAGTDETAQIKNLSLKGDINDFFVIEYSANESTIDITTGQKPIFGVLRGIFSAEQIKAKQPLYATPLSTLVVKLALSKAIAGSTTLQAIVSAEAQIKSLFTFGLDKGISLLNTAPLLTDATVASNQQKNTWYVRTINEVNAALVHQLRLAIGDEQLTVDHLLDQLVLDLHDGKLDAQSESDELSYSLEHIAVLLRPIHTLNIPGTDLPLVSELSRVMAEETAVTGYSTVDTSAMSSSELVLRYSSVFTNIDIDGDGISNIDDLDNDNDGINDVNDADDDNDGYDDTLDAFPLDPTEWLDTDSDGIGNNTDTDDDNDGVNDEEDAFPLNNSEWLDTDSDGIGNNSDTDDDNDGYEDAADAFPLNASEWLDTDADGTGNNADTDDDNDGVLDLYDAFPLDDQEWLDTDGDGTGNNADTDDDNDETPDTEDAFPTDPNEQIDTDGDGTGNNADADDDNDGFNDDQDAFPLDNQEWADTDLDGVGNNADTDDDNDGIADELDAFPLDATESRDSDGDGIGDNQDLDDDNDGFNDDQDAFPLDNQEWADTDLDGVGNNADTDDDNDGVADELDAFPLDATESRDSDGDGIGDNQDLDDDNDGTPDTEDHIQLVGAQNSYLTGEQINIRVKGFGNNFEVLSARDGWHVQYYTYDQASPDRYITKYTEDGYFNGRYDYDAMEWIVSFPAVEYSGSFQTRVSVYCSRADNVCGGQYNSDGWQQIVSYTVECASGSTCEYMPDPDPGVNITAQKPEESYASSLITRSNGDLLALYSAGFSRVVMSTSTDNGQSWSEGSSPPTNTSSRGGFLFEDSDNNLVLATSCNLASICIFKYEYNNWIAFSEIDLSEYRTCDHPNECMINTFEPQSMVRLPSGKYVLTYRAAPSNDYRQTNIYTRTSYNLRGWTEQKLAGGYQDYDIGAQTIQLPDGRVLMTYYSSEHQATIVSISSDGESFSEIQRLQSSGRSNPSLIEHNGAIRLFYSSNSTLYTRKFNEDELFSNEISVKSIDSFAPEVTELSDGTLGIIYSKDLNERRDVFYENIGRLED